MQTTAFLLLCDVCLHTERSQDTSIGGVAFSSSQSQREEAEEGYLINSCLCIENTEGAEGDGYPPVAW